ncbi:MAG TPA: T9SS type A sorting domain-containing protein, partial [Chitinophagaceae bacterium]|nr:T9SS type A sorting domain-containing protein [Chitinophagaceae bacterium]
VDKIRMKIYNKNTGQIIYDNMPGASDADAPIAVVCPGSTIRITDPVTVPTLITQRQLEIVSEVVPFNVKAYPNPTAQYFTLNVQSDNNEPVNIKVFTLSGKLVYTAKGSANQTYRFGDKLISGVYVAEVLQGDKRKTIKLVKQQ